MRFKILCTWALYSLVCHQTSGQIKVAAPHLEISHGAIQLFVAGKPFTMISGELHNSTSSTPEYFDEALRDAKKMNLNSVIASISWEQLEPQEGQFDFALLDHIIQSAHDNNLKLVLLWFASWKNGESSYMPLWVKSNTKRFFRIKDKSGKDMSAVSPFCVAAMHSDAKAFAAMMGHIKIKNQLSDVVMIQVENEVGALSEVDFGHEAQSLYNAPVPEKLVKYLKENRNSLDQYIRDAWETNGSKDQGTWAELFGEKMLIAKHVFMTWQYAGYINEICKQGKAAYNLPMYVNAWQDHDGQLPGKYPNGGPVAKVMDIYRAAGPDIDFIAPDIYLPNYRQICDKYFKPEKKNPLFIPECERTNFGKAFYAFGQDDAIGFGPFGIESMVTDLAYAQNNSVLKEILPTVTKYQGTKRMRAFIQQNNEDTTSINLGKYHIAIKYTGNEKKSFGLIIQVSEEEYLVAGMNFRAVFSSLDPLITSQIGDVLEGGFENNVWHTRRKLNGDETWHNRLLIVDSRCYSTIYSNGVKSLAQVLVPIPVLNQELEASLQTRQIKTAAIYKVRLYDYKMN